MRSPSPVRCWLLLIWLCFVVRGSFYAAALPLWEGFDEYSHYARIELLATEGRDPPRTAAVPADVADSLSRVPAKNGGMTFDEFWTLPAQQRQRPYPAASATVYEAQQPPLFYWLAAAIYKLTPGISMASHVLVTRLFCLLSASLCIPFGYLIALRVLPTSNLALQATLLIAAMPVSTFTATHVANEGLAIALGTIVVWAALEGRSIALLFAFGAALLTKAYFLAFLAPLGSLLYLRARTAKALAGSLLLAGWWYWNIWRTTGSLTGNVILVHPQLSEMLRSIFHFPVLSAAGFAWMTTADIDTTFWTLVCMVMVSRLGLGFINPSLNASSLKALPADKVRQGSGVANFMRQLGGAFGINLMVAFFEIRTRFHADALTATQDWGNRTTDRMLTQVEHLMQKSGLPFQQQKAGALEYLATMLQSNAQMMAFSDTFIVVGVVALLALFPAAMLSRSQRRSRR